MTCHYCHTKIHVFFKQKKYENLHLFGLIACKYMAKKSRCVEGLFPKWRAFLTNLHNIHFIENLSAKYCILYKVYSEPLCTDIALMLKVVFILSILHRNNVSLQTNIFFEPLCYLDICAVYEVNESKSSIIQCA